MDIKIKKCQVLTQFRIVPKPFTFPYSIDKRRAQSGGKKVDKRDIQKYMKKQEEPTNTAMADALKKLLDK